MEGNLTILDRIRKRFTFNRLGRLEQHYLAVTKFLEPATAQDKEEAAFFMRQFEYYARITERVANIRIVFFILIYAALIAQLLSFIPFLSFVIPFLEFGYAAFGTVAVLIVLVLSMRIRLNLELMQDCLTHLIVIYHKNPRRKSKSMLAMVNRAI